MTRSEVAPEIAARLQEWQAVGLLSPEQAARIARAEAVSHPAPRTAGERPAREALTGGEALAYVGAVLAGAGAGVLADRDWWGVTAPLRCVLLLMLAGAAALAGGLVPADDRAGRRLRATTWAVAAAATGCAAGVLTQTAGRPAADVALAGGVTAAVLAAVAWWWCRAVLLHVTFFAAAEVAVAAAGSHVTALHGQAGLVAVWVGALVWLLVGWFWSVVPERQASVLAAVAAVLAAQGCGDVDWGSVLAVGTAAAVLVLATWRRSTALLIVGAAGTFMAVPTAADRITPGPVSASIGLVAAGATLIAAAVVMVQLRQRDRAGATRRS